ncbi:integrin alpha-PS2 [Culicoides brevitarsis]|uniref:integrin alpha-PS2 n=1 Tax=Culicoides brevitarsis TaxID=469753 RepID=UPI00307B3401
MIIRNTKMAKSTLKFLLFVVLLTCQVITKINAFNIETTNYIRHEGESSSMFGFSVALHAENVRKWVIVGAPKAQSNQDGVRNGGVVYRCEIYGDNRCQPVRFDAIGHVQESTKSNQWFGATVASAGMNGPLIACAPRYVFHGFSPRKSERHEPVGTCFVTNNNFTTFDEISPCRTTQWGYHRQGSCQAGFSAAVTKTGDRMFIGAPGSWYWQGQVYSYNGRNHRDQSFATKESPSTDDDSYLGYSSVAGDFNGDGEQDVAVGMPRGAGLLGKIVILSQNMNHQRNITGKQIGEYFGYSLAVADVNGDNLDDLIVGAPMHTEPNNEEKYEVGRIYVFYQSRDESQTFGRQHFRDGLRSKSRFGLALSTLKDVNLDGYEDFAVGAPYDGENGRGCVYIYYGSQDGVREKASQVINAETIADSRFLKTFGFSLSGGVDLDGNTYPDLVVGAYESNRVLVFRSRPVVVIEATTSFSAENKLISLDNAKCFLPRSNTRVVCTQIDSCIKYHGKNVPPELDINVSWLLDAKKSKTPRLNFLDYQGTNVLNNTIHLYRNRRECRTERVYLVNVRDKLTPLEVEMKYDLPKSPYSSSQRQPTATLEPVLDLNVGTMQTDSINIQKNCGPDNICIPDLRLRVDTVDKFLLGSESNLKVEVEITNHGEDAFEAGFFMNVPQALNFRKTEAIGNKTLVTCTAPSIYNNGTLKCDIGNPLPKNREVRFNVILQPTKEATQAPSYDLEMIVNSTNPELDQTDFNNRIKKNIGIWIETNLTIFGTSVISGTSETKIEYNTTEYLAVENATTEAEIGPQTVHIYNIQNTGPSRIQESELYILWPYATQDNKPFVYLLNDPETHGNIKCERAPHINEYNLELDRTLVQKSYLESAGVYRSTEGATASRLHQTRRNETHFTSSSSSSSYSSGEDYSRGSVLGGAEQQRSQWSSSSASRGHNLDVIPPRIPPPTTTTTTTSTSRPVASGSRFSGWEASQGSASRGGYESSRGSGSSSNSYDREASYGSSSGSQYESGSQSRGAQGSYRGGSQASSGSGWQSVGGPRYEGGGGSTQYVSGSYGGAQGRDASYSSGGSWGSSSGSHSGSSDGSSRSYDRTFSSGSEYSGGRNYSSHSSSDGRHGSSSAQWGTRGSSGSRDGVAGTQNFNLNTIQTNDKDDDDGLKHYHLFVKREVDNALAEALQCTPAFKCAMFKCTVGPLENNDDAYIALRTRLVIKTLEQISTDPVSFSTMAVGRVTKLPYIDRPKNEPIKKHEIVNTASEVVVPTEGVIPLWVVILAALAGTLLLLLLILLLYKCGFFKRNRPSRSPETTPLKKAAYGHNDEHL